MKCSAEDTHQSQVQRLNRLRGHLATFMQKGTSKSAPRKELPPRKKSPPSHTRSAGDSKPEAADGEEAAGSHSDSSTSNSSSSLDSVSSSPPSERGPVGPGSSGVSPSKCRSSSRGKEGQGDVAGGLPSGPAPSDAERLRWEETLVWKARERRDGRSRSDRSRKRRQGRDPKASTSGELGLKVAPKASTRRRDLGLKAAPKASTRQEVNLQPAPQWSARQERRFERREPRRDGEADQGRRRTGRGKGGKRHITLTPARHQEERTRCEFASEPRDGKHLMCGRDVSGGTQLFCRTSTTTTK